jgi:hypothetical protein
MRHWIAALLFSGLVGACASTSAPNTASSSASPAATAGASASATPLAGPVFGDPLDGLRCDQLEQTAYHIHTRLRLEQGGQLFTAPADIGIGPDCLYWVHTHDLDGVIHIEAPATIHPSLGDFFAVWQLTDPNDPLISTFTAALDAGRYTTDPVLSNDGSSTPWRDIRLEDQLDILVSPDAPGG